MDPASCDTMGRELPHRPNVSPSFVGLDALQGRPSEGRYSRASRMGASTGGERVSTPQGSSPTIPTGPTAMPLTLPGPIAMPLA